MIYSLVGLGTGLVLGYYLGSRNNLDIDLYNAIKAEMKTEMSQKISKATKESVNNRKQTLRQFTNYIYGWNVSNNGKLIPNWDEQAIIDRMRLERQGHMPYAHIAKRLNAEGYKGKRGGKFYGTTVKQILANELHYRREEFREE